MELGFHKNDSNVISQGFFVPPLTQYILYIKTVGGRSNIYSVLDFFPDQPGGKQMYGLRQAKGQLISE